MGELVRRAEVAPWSEGGARRREHIEKSLERKIRLFWERKERAKPIWEDKLGGNMSAVIVSVTLSESMTGIAAMGVGHEGVLK